MKLKLIPSLYRPIAVVFFISASIVLHMSLIDIWSVFQVPLKDVTLSWLINSYTANKNTAQKRAQSPRCFWPYYHHGYHSASLVDNNEQSDMYNIEHLSFNSDANISASMELKSFHHSSIPDSYYLLSTRLDLFDDCLSNIKYQQLLLISLRQHKYCQLHFLKYNMSQLCALHNARLNSLSAYLPTHFNELISHNLTGPTKLNFLLNTYPYPKSKYFNPSGLQDSLFITEPDTVIIVYTSYGMWPMTKVWLLNILKYQPYLLPRILIGCYDYDVHKQVMAFNKEMSLLKITQMAAKKYSIAVIQSLWEKIYRDIPGLFIHQEIINQFLSSLVWSDQILPSFVVPHLSPLKLSANIDTKIGQAYLSQGYLHMVWGKVTNSHRALENGFKVIIHDTDELSFHDPTEWITPNSWSDAYVKLICQYQHAEFNTGLILFAHYNQAILKWWHGMELSLLYRTEPIDDQSAMKLLINQETRSIHMDYNGSLIAMAAIEKSRFEFRLDQRLNIRITAKHRLRSRKNKNYNRINEKQILAFIEENSDLLKDYQSTFASVCANQPSQECFYSIETIAPSKPTQRPKVVEDLLSNLTVLKESASNYLHTFSHLFINSNFSTYQFFSSVSEFVYYLSIYPSTNRQELAWCPSQNEGLSYCETAISKTWTNISQSIEAGTLLTYHYNCLSSYNAKVKAMKRHGNWIEIRAATSSASNRKILLFEDFSVILLLYLFFSIFFYFF